MLNGKAEKIKINKRAINAPHIPQSAANVYVQLAAHLEKLLQNEESSTDNLTDIFKSYLLQATQPSKVLETSIQSIHACIQLVELTIDHHADIDFKSMGRPNMKLLILTVIESIDPTLKSQKKDFIQALYRQKYFSEIDIIMDAFKAALNTANPNTLRDLLNHKNIIPNQALYQYADIILNDVSYLDLFYRLDPADYENKHWRDLTSYEKLYFIVFEYHFSKKLAHRIGLTGSVSLQWKQTPLSHLGVKVDKDEALVELEGQQDGPGFIQLKESLLLFQLAYQGKHQKILSETIEELISWPISMTFQFKHKLRDGKNHVYLFSLDGHMTSGYHTTTGRYYEINMGFLSGEFVGIQIYHVAKEQRPHLHARLTNLQYDHTTEHFHKIPKECALRRFGYIKLPTQPSGNCTYESTKGLFLAILFDRFCETLTNRQAAIAALTIYRQFCEYDGKDAIFDYRQHSICSNRALLSQAYRVKPSFLETQVYDHNQYVFHNLKKSDREDSTVHLHRKNKVRTICF